jgi:ADP-heptose:LPS heptosyltransferase
MPNSVPTTPSHILVQDQECLTVRLSALGDAILTTGVLAYWHDRAGLTFHVLTRPGLAPLFENHPAVRDIITVAADDLQGPRWLHFCRALARSHGHMPFVDLHKNLRTRILRLLWPGPTFGYTKHSVERRLFLATRHPLFGSILVRHNVPQRYALALESLAPPQEELRPRIFLTEQETAWAKEQLSRLGLANPVAIHPYATHPAKTPARHVWERLVRTLENRGEEILILGRDANPLFPASPRDLTNATDLRTTAALLSLCRRLVTGDSGPMHLATAVDTPVLALFGPTTREWGFFPSGPEDIIHQSLCPQAPCSLHGQDACRLDNACMADISDAVITSLLEAPSHLK